MASNKFYVTMTDSFMSGWGLAKGRINKLVFECNSADEAEIVAENARNRGDQKYISIVSKKPSYNSKTHYVQFKDKEVYPSWYKPNFFRKGA